MTEVAGADAFGSAAPLLDVDGLTVAFGRGAGAVTALDGVSFGIRRGETLALVGESGSGKSLTALALMGLLPPEARATAGAVRLDGSDLLALPPAALGRLRGDRVAMVFQEPMTSLNPVLTIGRQLTEGLEVHRGATRVAAAARAVDLLGLVGLTAPARRMRQYPHQLSGGMRQRVMIAMALACEPDLVIADEPTTALDVSVQAQIIDLLIGLKSRLGMAVLLITHDLGVVAEMADRIAVLYAGRLVEVAGAADLFDAPRHPYTEGLLGAVPRLDDLLTGSGGGRLAELPGTVPGPADRPPGCPFVARCPLALDRCARDMPPLATCGGGNRAVACWVRGPSGTPA